jgi:hypothetical protein
VRKHARGELHLERSLWALREAKWGKAKRRSVNLASTPIMGDLDLNVK